METLFIALALDTDKTITADQVSKLLNAKRSLIKVKPLNKCSGEDKVFRLLCDLYLCTHKYFKLPCNNKASCMHFTAADLKIPTALSRF